MDNSRAKAYLKRIGYEGSLDTSLETLCSLQANHLLSVPFENLDIHYNKRIEMDVAHFYEKVVNRNRGGFCYELNGLFKELLLSLGFETKLVSACVYSQSKAYYNPEFDHLAIIVQIDGRTYLTDVGFGEFSFSPILVDLSKVHKDDRGDFKFTEDDLTYLVVNKQENEVWFPEYRFSLKERQLVDFKERCLFQQTSPDSHFTQKRICSLPITNGRKTISGDKFILKENGIAKETEIKDESEFNEILLSHFQIEL